MAVTDTDYRSAADSALVLAYCISPTGEEQAQFSRLLNRLRMSDLSPQEIVDHMLSSVIDALRNGNYPKVID